MALTRKKHLMPQFVKTALLENKLMEDYNARPAYQRNDYLGWIKGAKRKTTQEKRLRQMLNELKNGGVYMKMKHNASKKYE